MLKMVNSKSYLSSKIILMLCLVLFCMLALMGSYHPGSTSAMQNLQFFDHHDRNDFEAELFIFSFFVFLAIGHITDPIRSMRLPICNINSSPQLPPPK